MSGNKQINVEIFDTAGQERFRTITTAYYKTARAFLLVFDVGVRTSFEHVKIWIDQIERFSHKKHVRFLIGNKIDSDRQISYDEAMDYAHENNCKYFEISAKTGKNIDSFFKQVMDVRMGCHVVLPQLKLSQRKRTHTHNKLLLQDLYETSKKKKDKKSKKSESRKADEDEKGCCVVQ